MPPTSIPVQAANPILPAPEEWIWLFIPFVVVLVIFALGVLTGWAVRRRRPVA